MTLDKLKIGDKAKIIQISCDRATKIRLHGMGISEGEEVKLLKKNTTLVLVQGISRVAVDRMLAEGIEVEI